MQNSRQQMLSTAIGSLAVALVVALVVGGAAAGCAAGNAGAGLHISYFVDATDAEQKRVVVEDSRYVTVARDGTFVIDFLPASVKLDELSLSVDGGVGLCAEAPSKWFGLHCEGAREGRRLARTIYEVDASTITVGHVIDITLTDDTHGVATITTQAMVPTVPSDRPANIRLTVDDDRPGHQNYELAKRTLVMTGQSALIDAGRVVVPVRLELLVYPNLRQVWTALIFEPEQGPAPSLLPAEVLVSVRDVSGQVRRFVVKNGDRIRNPIPQAAWQLTGSGLGAAKQDNSSASTVAGYANERAYLNSLRVPGWIVDDLDVVLDKYVLSNDESGASTSYLVTVGSRSDTPRSIWFEQDLPTAKKRSLVDFFPTAPGLVGDVARVKLQVPAHGLVRAGFQIDSEN